MSSPRGSVRNGPDRIVKIKLKGVEHAIEVMADSLYEAVAQGLRGQDKVRGAGLRTVAGVAGSNARRNEPQKPITRTRPSGDLIQDA